MEHSIPKPEAEAAVDTIRVQRTRENRWLVSASYIDLPMVYGLDHREEAMAWAADLAAHAARPILIVADPDPEELIEANGPAKF